MRSGVIVSVICHVVLVSGLMLSAPRRFGVPSETPVEVDLIRADEIQAPPDEPAPENKSESLWDRPGEKAAEAAATPSEPPSVAAGPPQQQAMSPNHRPVPSNSEQTASSRPSASSQSQPPPAEQQAPAQSKTPPSIFDPANIPALMEIANASGFDAEATATANLSGGERETFKAHLRKCWKLPAGVSPPAATRVVLRIHLTPKGEMASEPFLVEATASRHGPVVYQAAINALKTCQPFTFLPAAKYDEWKILDLTFTPREMAGG
jgi:hypothetical protein